MTFYFPGYFIGVYFAYIYISYVISITVELSCKYLPIPFREFN